MNEMFRAGDLLQHLEDDIRTGDIMHQPLSSEQMKAILQANNLNIVRFRSATHDTDVFDIVDADNSVVKGSCGLMDVETFIDQRGLRPATSTKETILLRSGIRIQRRVRDLDFMQLCDGRQYARCTYNAQDIEISRKRDANGNGTGEWQECLADESSIFVGQKCRVSSYGFGHVAAIRPNDPGLPGVHVLVQFDAGSRHEPSWFLSTNNIEFYESNEGK